MLKSTNRKCYRCPLPEHSVDFYGTIDGVKVYFACSSLNLKDSISSYLSVVKYIKKLQHRIPNDWLSRVKREYKKGIVDKEEDRVKLQEEGIRAVENCDVLIAEVSYPSGSVGFQIALALSLKKQVLCLYSTEFGEKSPPQIIKARDSANIHIFSYRYLWWVYSGRGGYFFTRWPCS